jgi:membrane associated rhomboid family serine protease
VIRPPITTVCSPSRRRRTSSTPTHNEAYSIPVSARPKSVDIAHVVSTFVFGDNPFIPSLGASGAISGIMGGYLVLHPHRRVRVIMVRMLTTVPAYVAVGLWFVFQLISAFGVIGQGPQSGGGVAFMAHIGGFIAGAALVKLFAAGVARPARA